jgi:hypothetical protein
MNFGRCPTCHRMPKRTDKQNSYYWKMLGEMSMSLRPKGEEFSPESWHAYFAERFLGMIEMKLPNGKLMQRRKSTTDLDKDEFSEYQTKIDVWAAEHGFWMPEREAA